MEVGKECAFIILPTLSVPRAADAVHAGGAKWGRKRSELVIPADSIRAFLLGDDYFSQPPFRISLRVLSAPLIISLLKRDPLRKRASCG